MIKTIADQYLAQNAGRRYPFMDDTELPAWLTDAAILDFRCTVRGVPAGTVPEARLTGTERTQDGSAQLTVSLTAGGKKLDTLRFRIPGDVAAKAPYTAYAAGEKAYAALTATAAALPPPGAKQLPYDTEVEYLESTGMQWIDTGVKVADPSTISVSVDSDGVIPFGVIHNNVGAGSWLGINYRTSATEVAVYSKNFSTRGLFEFSAGRHTFKWDGATGFQIDDVPKASFTATAGTDAIDSISWPLFGRYDFYNGSVGGRGRSKFYGASIEISGTPVRDYIAVRVGATGAVYDRRGVGGMNPDGSPRDDGMYFSRGTGSFRYGDDTPPTAGGDAPYNVDVPFAATTVVGESLTVRSLRSAEDAADARDRDDPDGRNPVAALVGEIYLAEGRNAEPYLDGRRLRVDVYKGAGLGEECQAPSASQTCGNVMFSINGERPGSGGDIRIVGGEGVTVTPLKDEHAVEIRMDDAVASRATSQCDRTCGR